MSSFSRSGLVSITAAGVLWGTAGVAVQLIRSSTDLGATSISFYRLAIAAVVLAPFAFRRRATVLDAVRAAPWGLTLTGVGLGVYQALYFLAVTLVGVSVSTVVSLGLAPVLVAAWESARAGRRPSRVTVGTVAAGVAGLALITVSTTHATADAPHPLLGVVVAVAAGLGYAASTVLNSHLSRRTDPLTLVTASTTVGALVLAPFAVVTGFAVPASPRPVALLAYLGVVTMALAYGLFYAGLRTTTGSVAVTLTLLEALTAAALAVVVLAEPLPAGATLGGLLLLGAVVVLYRAPQSSRTPATVRGG